MRYALKNLENLKIAKILWNVKITKILGNAKITKTRFRHVQLCFISVRYCMSFIVSLINTTNGLDQLDCFKTCYVCCNFRTNFLVRDFKSNKNEPQHDKTKKNQQNNICAQRRLRSAWASAQSDQSLRCALYGLLRTQEITHLCINNANIAFVQKRDTNQTRSV